VAASDDFFLLTHFLGNYRSNNAALPLQLLRWQSLFNYVRFSMEASTVRLEHSRDFQDLDVSEAARSMTEMEQAIDDYADKIRPCLDD